jgi:alkylation response protein AidB-like acyl-CoA dehydrogenase
VIDDAVQIWGGEGYMRENGLERMLRDARINRIVEGTTEVMTAFIALMGMKPVGEALEGVLHGVKHPFDNLALLAGFARSQWSDVVRGHEFPGLHPELAAEGHALARLTRQLARALIRLLATHRERILDLELIHERITGAVVDLYAMAAVLGKLQATRTGRAGASDPGACGNGRRPIDRDLLIGRSFCQNAAARVHGRLRALFANDDRRILQDAEAMLTGGA